MYKITYMDDSIFIGGDIANSRWNEICKPIKCLEYSLLKQPIILKDYDAYNHLIEKVYVQGQERILKIILMARKGEAVDCINIDFQNNKAYKSTALFGAEYCDRPTTGWKVGISRA